MITITKDISLKGITLKDTDRLLELMHRIYPPPYKHLWEDNGEWYVENTFNAEVLKKELFDENAGYYFVEFENETIGILRILLNVSLDELKYKKATKLHRIYLSEKAQGKSIGKVLLDFSIQQAIENKAEILWLEVMDTQQQALHFYKKLDFQIISDFKLKFELMHEHLRGMHRMYKILG